DGTADQKVCLARGDAVAGVGDCAGAGRVRADVVPLDGDVVTVRGGHAHAVAVVARDQVARPRHRAADQNVVDVLDHVDAVGVAERGLPRGVGADAVALDGDVIHVGVKVDAEVGPAGDHVPEDAQAARVGRLDVGVVVVREGERRGAGGVRLQIV